MAGRRGLGVAGWLAACAGTLVVGVYLGAGHASAAQPAAVAQPVAKVAPKAPASCVRLVHELEGLSGSELNIINELRGMVNARGASSASEWAQANAQMQTLNRWGVAGGSTYAKDRAACLAGRG